MGMLPKIKFTCIVGIDVVLSAQFHYLYYKPEKTHLEHLSRVMGVGPRESQFVMSCSLNVFCFKQDK